MNCSATRFLHTDYQGSVIALADCYGNRTNANKYDEFGIPAASSFYTAGAPQRFGYTGQAWIPELGMWYYKTRLYAPTLGRFMQTDPIGYGDGMNWYNYVGGDPVNWTDPSGLYCANGSPGGNAEQCKGKGKGKGGYVPGSPYTQPDGPGVTVTGRGSGPTPPPSSLPPGSVTSPGLPPPPREAGGGGVGPQKADCSGPLRRPSREMMNEATNAALADAVGRGRAATTSPLTSEFARLNSLPDFRAGGWTSSANIHGAVSYEHALPGSSGMAVKVYIGDRNFGGANTITITPPTNSFSHWAGVPTYLLGMPENARNAAVYLSSKEGC